MRGSWVTASAGAVAVLTTPIVTWWIIGDLSETTIDPAYVVEPPSIGASTELALGIIASTLLVVALATLVVATRDRRFDRGWWLVILLLMGAGWIVAFSARILTAGVVGANIGGGLAIIFGGPLVLALIAWAGTRAVLLIRRTRREPVRG